MTEVQSESQPVVHSPAGSAGQLESNESVIMTIYRRMGEFLPEDKADESKSCEEDILRRFDAFAEQFNTYKSQSEQLQKALKDVDEIKKICLQLQDQLRSYEGIETELDEVEEQNERLKTALKAAKDNFEAGLQQQNEYEQTIIQLRSEKNGVEQQLLQLTEKMDNEIQTKVRAAEKDKERAERKLKDKDEEVTAIKRTWDQASKQFEEEQKVLRQWKTNLESQLANSEKTLQDINKRNSSEINRLNYALLDSQKNVQEAKYQVIEKEAEIRSLQMNYEEMRQSLEDKIKDLELQVSSLTTKLKIENESNNELNQKVGNFDTKLQARLKEALTEMENKDREIIRQNQKNHDEEIARVRKHVSNLSTELEQERAVSRKLRETVNQLNETINKQEQMMDALRGEVAAKDSELLAGRQQVTKLSRILAKKLAPK